MSAERVKEEKEKNPPPPPPPPAVACNSIESVPPAVMGHELTADQGEKNPNQTDMMTWMDGLNENQLFAAFTMEDVPFLASILAVSSWSLAARGQTDRLSGALLGECT